MDAYELFKQERESEISAQGNDLETINLGHQWMAECLRYHYINHFEWLGRPIVQFPMDIVGMQEIIWEVKPDLIIETGIAHGGSLAFSASMLALLEYCEAAGSGKMLDPRHPQRKVLGIDIDIRAHNRAFIEAHPMASRIDMIEGSSIAPEIIERVHEHAKGFKRILVCLDSMHTHEHVLAELKAYAPLVSMESYCVVFDTFIEDMPKGYFSDRPWDKGNNPRTALVEYLRQLGQEGGLAVDGRNLRFKANTMMEDKLLITANRCGFLKRVNE